MKRIYYSHMRALLSLFIASPCSQASEIYLAAPADGVEGVGYTMDVLNKGGVRANFIDVSNVTSVTLRTGDFLITKSYTSGGTGFRGINLMPSSVGFKIYRILADSKVEIEKVDGLWPSKSYKTKIVVTNALEKLAEVDNSCSWFSKECWIRSFLTPTVDEMASRNLLAYLSTSQ